MWEKLRNCKTFSEMYGVIGEFGCERLSFYFLCIFSLVPVIMSVIYCFVRGDSTYDTLYIHEGLFCACGGILLAVGLFWICNEKSEHNILRKYSFKKNPWVAFLLFLLPWSIFSACFSVDKFHAFFGTDYSFDGVLSYFLYAAFFVSGFIIKNEKLREKLLMIFSAAADITALIIICEGWQVPIISDIFNNNGGNAGCFTNSNHAAYYICTTAAVISGLIMTFAYDAKKIKPILGFYIGSLALQLYALFVDDTYGSTLAICFAIFIALPLFFMLSGKRAKGKRIIIAITPLILMLLMIILDILGIPLGIGETAGKGSLKNLIIMLLDAKKIFTGDESAFQAGSGRWKLWVHYFNCFLKHPITGLGPEGLEEKYTIFLDYTRPHNEYIIYLSYLGLPGFLAYMSALLTICIDKFKKIRELSPVTLAISGAVVCYLFSAFFGNTKFYTYPYFWMLLGLLVSDDHTDVLQIGESLTC